MKKSIVLVTFFALASFFGQVQSQADTLKNQILNFEQSKHEFLDKGRRMLLESFEQNDIPKVRDVKNLLLKENNGNVYNTFYPIEYIQLLYWTEDYAELLDFLKQIDYTIPVSPSVDMLVRVDNLYPTLKQKTAAQKELLLLAVHNSSESQMNKDFLTLQLEDVVRVGEHPQFIDFESERTQYINRLSDAFLEAYPNSPYDKIVRENIRYKFESGTWGVYCDLVGLGTNITTGNLAHHFDSGFTMEMAFEARYKKIVGVFGFGFSGHSLKQDIPIQNVTWSKGLSSTQNLAYLNGGYLLLNSKRFSLYPFVGIGYGSFSANAKDSKEQPELKDLHLQSFFTQVGLGFDIKFKFAKPYSAPLYYPDSSQSRISVRYSYRMPHYEQKFKGMEGYTHSIVVSWGIGGASQKRVM